VDVASAAGVSVSTVSRVINGSELPIRVETQERVWAATRTLGYRPNAVARSLKLASTGALGLLVPSLRNPAYAEIIRGAFDSAWSQGFVVLLAEDADSHTAQEAYERLVQEGRIDGLLIASTTAANKSVLERLLDESVPCVFVNRRLAGSGRNVVMREEAAGRLAGEHLLALGHRRLAIVAGPRALDTARRRRRGFIETAAAAGVEVHVRTADYDEAAGFRAMGEILELRPRPTGVFVSNVNQAIGAVAAARRGKVRIPAELSLITNDDVPFVEYLETPLTTIRMPLEELGRLAVGALVAQLSGAPARNVLVPTEPELVLRESTGPASG
jgi:LacI family transcriptional regulator